MKEIVLEGLEEKIYEYTTKNGLKVYMWINEKVNGCFASLSVKYGSIHTKFKVGKKVYTVPNGLAHFLEHIKFNMKEDVTAHDEFIKIGGDSNAFTTFKYTSYIVFATQNKIENLNLLLDFVYNPYFTKKMISKEKGIIVEESNMSNDDPYSKIFYDNLKNVLQKSNYRNLITGEVEDIKEISLDDVEIVYDTFYHPKNMFLTITGNFNPYEMAKTVEDNLAKKEFGEFQEVDIISESEPKKVTKDYLEENVGITYPRVKYSLKIPVNKFKNVETIDLKLLCDLILNINFGSTSEFRSDLILKGLVTSMGYSLDIYEEYLVITITANTNYQDEVIKLIREKFDNLEVDEKDIVRKRNAAIATLILDYEDIEQVNMKIQDDIINEGEIITDLKIRVASINQEKLESVINYINNDNVAISVFKPKENQE
ncbi:MAG TPA: insulinase family protein [Candidatus Onthocola stercoravium]|nr:insulinase family protein [Candidatus Onthocola stercoravium]